jgi:hypothetical protein
MGWSATAKREPYHHYVDDVLDAANARFERVRHTREASTAGEPTCLEPSRESVAYIEAFWAHVGQQIAADPRALGTSVQVPRDGVLHTITVEGIRHAMCAEAGDDRDATIKAAALAPLVVMNQILNQATAAWAGDLRSGRCPLAYELDAERYVSLRALLPRRGQARDAVGGNAPTLVMGGTATAIAMCWNLLGESPRALRELEGRAPDAAQMETLWAQTRELIFRIGGGSLSAFVALASACSSKSSAMAWDGAGDLGLGRRGERYVWMMNDNLYQRYQTILETVIDAQQGQYVGCAALYARVPPLPLAVSAADEARDAVVFNEVLRWITAVARAEFFPVFDE